MIRARWNLLLRPYLLGFLLLVLGYTALHWLFVQKLVLISLDEVVLNLGVPMVLAFFFSHYILRKKLEILDLGKETQRHKDGSSFLLWLALSGPVVMAQYFMVSATGQLTELRSIEEIQMAHPTKFYKVSQQFLDKEAIRSYSISKSSSDGLSVSIYSVIPAYQSSQHALNTKPSAWYGIKFHKNMSSRLAKEEKDRQYERFKQESLTAIAHFNSSSYQYFNRISESKNRDIYLEAIRINSQNVSSEIVLVGQKEPFDNRYTAELRWLIAASLVSILMALAVFFLPKIDQKVLDRIRSGKTDA